MQRWPVLRTLGVAVAYLPLLLALWVCCTRVIDYWHHYADVVAGYVMGAGGGWLAFRYVSPSPATGAGRAEELGGGGGPEGDHHKAS